MNFRLCCCMVLLLLAGCKEQESLPVSERELMDVLIDVHAAEGAMAHLNGEEKDSVATVYYRQIMEIHQMKQQVFDTCVAILKRNPAMTERIYEKINEEFKKSNLEDE